MLNKGPYTACLLLVVFVTLMQMAMSSDMTDSSTAIGLAKRRFRSNFCRRCIHSRDDWASCSACFGGGDFVPFVGTKKRSMDENDMIKRWFFPSYDYNPEGNFYDVSAKRSYDPGNIYNGDFAKRSAVYDPTDFYSSWLKRAYKPDDLDEWDVKRAYDPDEFYGNAVKRAYNPFEIEYKPSKRAYNPYEIQDQMRKRSFMSCRCCMMLSYSECCADCYS